MFVQYACKKVAVRQMSVMLRKCQHMGTTPGDCNVEVL